MTEAGWYKAEGDPLDTQRYWDGSTWVGDPVPIPPVAPASPAAAIPAAPPGPPAFEPPAFERPAYETATFEPATFEPSIYEPPVGSATAPHPPAGQPAHPYGNVSQTPIPNGLKILAIVVSVLKAIPLVIATALVAIIAILGSSLSDGIDGAVGFGFGGIFILLVLVPLFAVGAASALLFFQLRGALQSRRSMLLGTASFMAAIDVFFFLAAAFNGDDPVRSGLPVAVMAAQVTIAVWAFRWKPGLPQVQ